MNLALQIFFGASLVVMVYIGWLMFRDLADISQWVVRTSRNSTMRTFRWRHWLAVLLLVAVGLATGLHFGGGIGSLWLLLAAGGMAIVGFVGGYLNPPVMMRSQQKGARYYSIAEAREVLDPDTSLIVVESAAGARGHPDAHILRPHVAGLAEGVPGDDGVLTYCGLTNLGIAFDPEIDGQRLSLKVMTQLENNLVLWDENTGEPIQQVWGSLERDGKHGPSMRQRPSFRMPLWAFERAYPEGTVFLNPIPGFLENPFLAVYDRVMHKLFTWGVTQQATKEEATFPTIRRSDDRLPNKEKVYVGSIGDDHVAWTEDFIRAQGGVLNAKLAGQDIVVAYHPDFDSVGMYRNETGRPIETIAFGGRTERGTLPRLETMKAGAFWLIWQNWFPQTDVNRAPVTG